MIRYHSECTDFIFNYKRNNSKWLKFVIEKDKQQRLGDINIIFCTDAYLLDINRKYLLHDYRTDVITFQYNFGEKISGDIFISIDMVRENAILYSNGDFYDELRRVMLHGVLHLIGYKDAKPDDKREMREKENYYLEIYNINDERL